MAAVNKQMGLPCFSRLIYNRNAVFVSKILFRQRGMKLETDFPAEQAEEIAYTWLSGADAHTGRSRRSTAAAG